MDIHETGAQTPNNKKILVVEDEIPILKALTDKLTREGFIALEATDGAEGLKIALRERPDAILLDLVMPEMTGLDVLKNLRGANPWGKQVPVIILTNLDLDNNRLLREISENEPSYYLVKSAWKIEDVVKKIKECVGI